MLLTGWKQHEIRGGQDIYRGEEDEVGLEDRMSVTSRRSGTRTVQTKAGAKSGVSARSGPECRWRIVPAARSFGKSAEVSLWCCAEIDEAKWRVNQGNWDDIGSSEYGSQDETSMHNMPTARPGGVAQRGNATHAPHATAHIFFDATWQELVG